MSPRKLIRWSGVAGVLGGLWTLMTPFSAVGSDQMWYFAIGTTLMIFTVTGIYAAQVEKSGWFGLAGYIMVVIGEVLFMIEGDPADPMGVLAGSLYAVGLLMLAIGTYRAGVFSKRPPLLWLAAIVIGVPGFAIESLMSVLIIVASVAYGLGFILAGVELLSDQVR